MTSGPLCIRQTVLILTDRFANSRRNPTKDSTMRFRTPLSTSLFLAATLLAGCGKAPQQQMQMPPPEVGTVVAKAQAVPLMRDLVGRLYATRSADVRARVAGVLQKRVYTEGSDVKAGQLLFQIDPAPLKAALNAQQANLAAAQATYTNNHVAAERARSVGAKGLISKADVDNALAAERTAAAAVKQAQANVETAKINLGYADVVAPIAGRAGQQQVTEGALVGQSDATLLTTVEQIDPIYVYFSQAVGELDTLRRAQADGHVSLEEANKAKVEIVLPDGSAYAHAGTLDFSDTQVNAATGAVELRGIVPNPEQRLLPGMYVSVRLTLGQTNRAWLIPQAAMLRDAAGPYLLVVGADGKVVQKQVTADAQQGGDFVVTTGLSDGDKVIVSGVQHVRPGAPAKAVPWQPAAAQNTAH